MKSILMSLLLVTNNSNKLNYIGNDLKNPVFDSDIRYGYDERFFNKTENNDELIKISLDIKRQNLLNVKTVIMFVTEMTTLQSMLGVFMKM